MDTKAEKLAEAIKETLKSHNIDCDVSLKNFNKCISIEGKYISVWIRTLNIDGKYFIVDLNNIHIDNRYKRKGICTDLIKTIRSRRYVDKAYISSVCTREMTNFVKKHKMKYNPYIDAWVYKEKPVS